MKLGWVGRREAQDVEAGLVEGLGEELVGVGVEAAARAGDQEHQRCALASGRRGRRTSRALSYQNTAGTSRSGNGRTRSTKTLRSRSSGGNLDALGRRRAHDRVGERLEGSCRGPGRFGCRCQSLRGLSYAVARIAQAAKEGHGEDPAGLAAPATLVCRLLVGVHQFLLILSLIHCLSKVTELVPPVLMPFKKHVVVSIVGSPAHIAAAIPHIGTASRASEATRHGYRRSRHRYRRPARYSGLPPGRPQHRT